jgi:uncharacterized protein GlcG (DUF336 family)
MNIAVVDAGGDPKAFLRMHGAWLGSVDIAIKKARTAGFFDMPTGELGALSQPGGPLFNVEVSNGGLITFLGGIPLRSHYGEVVGGVGVSGSTVENDHTVALAGADNVHSRGPTGVVCRRSAAERRGEVGVRVFAQRPLLPAACPAGRPSDRIRNRRQPRSARLRCSTRSWRRPAPVERWLAVIHGLRAICTTTRRCGVPR